MNQNNDQKLIDILFSCVLLIQDPLHRQQFDEMSREELAAWVRKQLDGCGFYTEPAGMSWGVLTKRKTK